MTLRSAGLTLRNLDRALAARSLIVGSAVGLVPESALTVARIRVAEGSRKTR
jgi:hypothetical protein